MTIDDAIENLNMISAAFIGPVIKEQRKLINETFDMAIKALEQEPKTDIRECKNCKYSKDGYMAGTEECHGCMWEPKVDGDCISRAKAIECLNCGFDITGKKNMEVVVNYINSAHDKIMNLPNAQPKPKTGHWECNELFYNGESRGAIITCSKCGNEFKVSPKVFENLYSNERFCNHCGAKMKSEG